MSVHRMQGLGIPVPPAFVIGTEACGRYERGGGRIPEDVTLALPDAMRWLESVCGKTFGGGERPLLVSVRSGAAISMPGMMDTVLNLGMNDEVERALGRLSGMPAFAADVSQRFEHHYREIVGHAAPADPWQQLLGAIAAVFASWNSARAIAYRRDRGIPGDGGTAVTVQAMVFGNLDDRSGTGVLFSRDPIDGSPEPYGEWLLRGQGEDVVSGRRTPAGLDALKDQMPAVHRELLGLSALLEREARDVQDIEFTIESGKLWLLQTRSAKRSPAAAVRLAVALQQEGQISPAEALDRVTAEQVSQVLQPHIDPTVRRRARRLAMGKLACPGVVSGTLVTDVDEAESRALAGESIILARPTTNPDDVHAMSVVAGVLTELGGSTSHAAVVSREIGVPCIVGCGEGALVGHDQSAATMDAAEGGVYEGRLPVIAADEGEHPDLGQLARWARAEVPDRADQPLATLLGARRDAGPCITTSRSPVASIKRTAPGNCATASCAMAATSGP